MKNLSDIINNHHNEIASFVDGVRKETYEKARAEAIDDRSNLLAFICKKYNIPLLDMNCTVNEWEESEGRTNDISRTDTGC